MKTASEAVDVLLIVNARSAPEENIESNEIKIYAIGVIEMMTARTHDTTSRAAVFAEEATKIDDTVVRCNVNCETEFLGARTIPRRTIRRRGLDDGVVVVHVAEKSRTSRLHGRDESIEPRESNEILKDERRVQHLVLEPRQTFARGVSIRVRVRGVTVARVFIQTKD